MKRRIFSVLVVALVALSSLEAGFSDPLPKYTQETGLLQRTGIGFYFDTDLFFAEGGRTGLSLSFLYSHPIDSHAWIIPGDSDNDNDTWVFTEEPSIFIAYGPMFRGRVGLVDLGRGRARTYSAQAEPVYLEGVAGAEDAPYIICAAHVVKHDDHSRLRKRRILVRPDTAEFDIR